MTVQSISSIFRQVLAVVAGVAGIVTASVAQLHLPPAVSTALIGFAGVILTVEHYVSDPSTGTTQVIPTAAPAASPAVPAAPPAA